jgi:hypothetical protein
MLFDTKSRSFPRTSSRRRRSNRKIRTARNQPMRDLATKSFVRRQLPKVEQKEVWIHNNEVQLNTLTQGYFLDNGPPVQQGTAAFNRIGIEIAAVRLHVRGVLSNNSTSESLVRMVVLFSQKNVDPSLQLFETTPAGTVANLSTLNGLDAMYYPINSDDFTVAYDRVFKLAGSATGNAANNVQLFEKSFSLGKKRIKFDANLTGQTQQTWQYYVVYIAADANDDTSTGTVAELSSLTRFVFEDT